MTSYNDQMMKEITQKLEINEKMEGKRVDPSQLGKGGMVRKNSRTSLEREMDALNMKNGNQKISKASFSKMMSLESARSFNESATSPMNMSANL